MEDTNPEKKRVNHVESIDFWAERLNTAKQLGHIHSSVYQVGEYEMDKINVFHKKLLDDVIKPDTKVLDAGCGYGRNASWFSPDQYVGVDFAPAFIKEAQTLHPEYKFVQGDLKKLHFSNKSFDVALCLSIRHMIKYYLGDEEWNEIQKELRRVARSIIFLEYTTPEQIEIL